MMSAAHSAISIIWVIAGTAVLVGLVLLAFGLKLPVVPLHGWQPLTYSQAPTPVAMLLHVHTMATHRTR